MLLAESACPAGRGSTVAGKDNTPLVMLTEGGLLSLWPLSRGVNEEQNGQKAGSVSEALGLGCPHTG